MIATHPTEIIGPRLFTRGEAMAILRIGATSLHWLQRLRKLKPVRIGGRVLFHAAEVERLAIHGATLTGVEKKAAANRNAPSTASQRGRRARAPKPPRPSASTACT